MLSRIARGLYTLGRQVERAQNVIRILEVNHKMNLERSALDEVNVWSAISEAFQCEIDPLNEARLYDALVLSANHPYSVRFCIDQARDEGRSIREHISEEMWFHLNRMHLGLADLTFDGILRIGRSEFNRQIEVFGDALQGLADNTMILGEPWAFLRIGKSLERASMICRIIEIKRKVLSLTPDLEGRPLDVHQWQALLRSLSGYEPYRRAYDARIVPERVFEFVVKRPDFPRSLACTLLALESALNHVSGNHRKQLQLVDEVRRLIEEVNALDPEAIVRQGSFDSELRLLTQRCLSIEEGLELAYFTSLRPASEPITAAPGSSLVPQ